MHASGALRIPFILNALAPRRVCPHPGEPIGRLRQVFRALRPHGHTLRWGSCNESLHPAAGVGGATREPAAFTQFLDPSAPRWKLLGSVVLRDAVTARQVNGA